MVQSLLGAMRAFTTHPPASAPLNPLGSCAGVVQPVHLVMLPVQAAAERVEAPAHAVHAPVDELPPVDDSNAFSAQPVAVAVAAVSTPSAEQS